MEFNVGKTVKVVGLSRKGKSRIKQWGDLWIILSIKHLPASILIISKKDRSGKAFHDSVRRLDLPVDTDMKIVQ